MDAKTQDAAGETGDEHTATCRANKAGTLHYLGESAPCICQPSAWRRKPVVLAALEWTGHNLREVIAFTGRHESARDWTWEHFEDVVRREGLKIFTLEGPHHAAVGDFIVRGVKGEFWPVKPDIFAATYEPAQPPATPRETAIAAPTGETVPGLWEVMVSMALKPRQVCVSATDEAQVAALLAARAPAPSAPQEPRGEPSEGMVESALNAMCGCILDSRRPWHTDERALMRKALAAALDGEGK